MNRESLDKLRLDRRLMSRRGWMKTAERARALEELTFFSREVRILGVYPAHPFRMQANGG